MPELISSQPHDNGGRLKFILNLTNVECPEAWEGWIVYEIMLMAGDDIVATSTQRPMMDDEIIRLCEVLESSAQGEFEPMEPDFQLIFRPAKSKGASESYEAFIFVNEAIRRKEGYYSRDGLGLKLPLKKSDCHEFATQLRVQLSSLTAELKR